MSSAVQLPAPSAGRLTCDITLATRSDQQVFIDKLKAALELLKQRNGSSSTAPPAAALPAAPAAPAPPVAAPLPALPAQAAPPSLFPGAAPAAQPPPPVAAPAPAAPPAAAVALPPLPRQPASAAPPLQRPQPVAAPPPPRPQPTAPPATAGPPPPAPVAASGPSWELCWTTDAADHSSDPVTSMAYLPAITGLAGGEGHAGWLISSSRGLLNLWEASPSGGRGEAALMCMHSQGTDYSSVCLDGERSTRMLLSASMDGSGGEWVTAHSLELDTLLAPKGRCPMPHSASSKIQGQNCLAVASLHGYGGPLSETCVASYGGALVVWAVGNCSKPAASNAATPGSMAPRALWKAHDALITTLHRSQFGLSLFSGAADGKIHMFNMREKPNQPLQVFKQEGRITGIHQINDSQLLTTAGDGRMMVWDLRSNAGPIKFAVPDARPIVRMALSPFADSVAVATTGGIYQIDLLDSACHVTPISPGQPKAPCTALTWNTATSEVIVAGGPSGTGTITVFKQRLGGY